MKTKGDGRREGTMGDYRKENGEDYDWVEEVLWGCYVVNRGL